MRGILFIRTPPAPFIPAHHLALLAAFAAVFQPVETSDGNCLNTFPACLKNPPSFATIPLYEFSTPSRDSLNVEPKFLKPHPVPLINLPSAPFIPYIFFSSNS